MESDNKYTWVIHDEIPEGFIIDKTAGSPVKNTVFITNGKSVLNGQIRALLRVKPKPSKSIECNKQIVDTHEVEKRINEPYPAKIVNNLAREKFKQKILQEILFDLQVCEIEGWNKLEYIKQIRELINGIPIK